VSGLLCIIFNCGGTLGLVELLRDDENSTLPVQIAQIVYNSAESPVHRYVSLNLEHMLCLRIPRIMSSPPPVSRKPSRL
jgi:hypothetical protein